MATRMAPRLETRIAQRRRRRRRRFFHVFLILFAIWNAIDLFHIRRQLSRAHDDDRSQTLVQQKVFIASIHWNNEAILRSHWSEALVDLVRTLGPENVFVSIYESGSYDNTKDALLSLDQTLGQLAVPRNITLSDVSHWDDMQQAPTGPGWIQTKRGKKELRRIPYLARLRNLSLEPLAKLADQGEYFDKVLFLNDVVFTTRDVFKLLNTQDGRYAAACSLDFSHAPHYYDTFALRDIEGNEPIMSTWPFFGSAASREALERMDPVPVKSCWNGIMAMPALPFVAMNRPLRFRGIADSLAGAHLEGSECCLIHADNPMTSLDGVWVNPKVRVGYNGPAYDAVHPDARWLSSWRILRGLWENRLRRWTHIDLRRGKVRQRVSQWEREHMKHEPGDYCLVDETQVLMEWVWAHV